jgi:hypothetical protein
MTKRTRYLAGAVAVLAMILVIMTIAGRGGEAVNSASDSGVFAPVVAQSPTTAPSDTKSLAATGQLLPEEYSILESHNAFGRGHSSGKSGGVEASFVFKGAVRDGTRTTAFFEDLTSKTVTPLEVGATIARGRIKSIDLDAVVYTVANDSRRIEAGQNLQGVVIPPAPTSQPSPAPPQPQQAAADGAPPNPQAPPMPQ